MEYPVKVLLNRMYLLFLSCLLLVSCSTPGSLSEKDKAQIREDILEMFGNYFGDIKKDGLHAEFNYLDNSDDFFWAPPGYHSTLTYDSVRAILEVNAVNLEQVEFDWDTLQIFPISHNIATYSGIVRGSILNTNGDRSNVLMIESGTLIKREDGWKLLSGQSANIEPAANGETTGVDSIK